MHFLRDKKKIHADVLNYGSNSISMIFVKDGQDLSKKCVSSLLIKTI